MSSPIRAASSVLTWHTSVSRSGTATWQNRSKCPGSGSSRLPLAPAIMVITPVRLRSSARDSNGGSRRPMRLSVARCPRLPRGASARCRLHIGLTTGGAYGNKDRGAGRARKAGRPAPAALRVTGRAAREFGAEGEREGVERLVRALDPAAAQRSAGHALACSGKLTGDIAGVLGARLRGARDGDYGFSRSMAVLPGQRLGPVRGAG